MIVYEIVPLIEVVFSFILLVLLVVRGKRHIAQKPFFLFLFSMLLWGFFIYLMRREPDLVTALFWERLVFVAIFSASILFYRFTVSITGARPRKWLHYLPHVLYFTCLALLPTKLMVSGMQVMWYGKAPMIGPLFPTYVISVYLPLTLGLVILMKHRRRSRNVDEKIRFQYIIAGIIAMFIGGTTDYLPVLGISMYPLGIVGNILFCVLATVAMLRYDLLETKVIIRKGIAYSLVGVLVLGIFGGMTLLLSSVFQTTLNPISITIMILSVFVALLVLTVFQPVLVIVRQMVDRLFYRERYDYLKALEQFSHETQSIANMQELGSNMVQLVAGALRTSSACLLLPSSGSRGLRVASSVGLEDPPRGIAFSDRNLFLKWMNTHGRTISSRELDIVPELHGLTQVEKHNLDMLHGDLYVPIRTRRGVLSGVLVLGEKLRQESYSNEDRQLLATLAGQMAMVFENASLYRRSQQEVTERKQAEEHLRASEEKLRLTFESMAEGIVVTDLDGDIIQVNEAVVRMHGYADREDLIGNSIISLVAKQDHTMVMGSLETTLAEGYTRDIECTSLGDNDNEFPVRLRTAVLKDASGGPTGFVFIIEDATERKKMEDQLRHSQLLASLGEMTAGIAHEVNNPLQSVLLYSDLLMVEKIPPQSKKDLRVLRNEAKRAAHIMTDLLTYSRRAASQERRIDLHRVIRRVLSMRRYAQTVQNVTVTANLMDGPLPVRGDSSQLTQVFMNLIVNAEEALTESENRTIVVTSTVYGEWVKVSVTDSGIGIPAENLNQVFYPFFTTKHEVKGTGLGLSTCYGIVTDHGGLIYATNNLTGGATFTVELPLATNESPKKLVEQVAGAN